MTRSDGKRVRGGKWRKFRSLTSENMDTWKSIDKKKHRHEISQKREDKRWIRSEKEKVRREKMQVLEQIWNSRKDFYQWFVVPQVLMSEMKHCTSLWHETYVQVSMKKTLHARSTFGCWHVEKVHGVVVRSTFWRAKCIHHAWTIFGSWDVEEMRAVAARDMSTSKGTKYHMA